MGLRLSDPQEFSEFLKSHRAALIYFYADWNLHERGLREVLTELQSAFPRVGFGEVSVDQEEMFGVCRQVGFPGVPTLAYYKDGELVERITGLESEEKIKERITNL